MDVHRADDRRIRSDEPHLHSLTDLHADRFRGGILFAVDREIAWKRPFHRHGREGEIVALDPLLEPHHLLRAGADGVGRVPWIYDDRSVESKRLLSVDVVVGVIEIRAPLADRISVGIGLTGFYRSGFVQSDAATRHHAAMAVGQLAPAEALAGDTKDLR